MANLFFLVSGEFESLSFSELKAILAAEGFTYAVTEFLDQTVRLQADAQSVREVLRRSGYTRVCAQELFVCEANDEAIVKAASGADFEAVLCDGETFEVRIRRIKEYATKEATMKYERLLGKLILQNAPKAKVDLKKPQKTFFGVLTNGKLLFGVKMGEVVPKPFVERRARKKPFFHPSAMNAKLARCMVNLAHAQSGSYVLDPFSGTGSTLIEASLIGCKAVGIDVQRHMAKGTLKNIRHFGLEPEGVIAADSRKLPLSRVDCVVTDPPYGRSSTTMKSSTKAIVEGIFSSVYPFLGRGQRICIASPKTLNVKRIGEQYGYRHLESHFAYVHRSLTREVAVFEKV
ncbi:MAG: DNA methyltransferase [Candidatus Bathyarchaeota archaeon]|nr:DNA methyltransferase [Candidatus Bathyarchaeota archaeon]